MRKLTIGVAVLVLGVCLATPAAAAEPPLEIHQRVRGTGGAVSQLPNEFNGDYIRFAFDARADIGQEVHYGGTFHVWHFRKDGSVGAEFSGEVFCLMASADFATLSGRVTETQHGDTRTGKQANFSVVGNTRHPRVGFGGEPWGEAAGNMCSAPAPYFGIDDGGYRIDADGM
jgi:hypothetical protein